LGCKQTGGFIPPVPSFSAGETVVQLDQILYGGDLQGALKKLQEQVRKEPAAPKHRIFLFQLLAIMGQWERALTQLSVLGEMDAENLPMVQTYREALRCEMLRAEIFAGRRTPLIFGDPEPWVALLLEALRLTAEGHYQQASAVRAQSFETAPTSAGVLDGQAFAWIADADTRLGPIIEAIVNGRYYWIPFHRIRSITLEAPTDLRDLVWTPAQLTWSNGGETVGLIPVRYPESEKNTDSLIQTSRKTAWLEYEGDTLIGLGQRMWATDIAEYSFLEIRSLTLTDTAQNTGSENTTAE